MELPFAFLIADSAVYASKAILHVGGWKSHPSTQAGMLALPDSWEQQVFLQTCFEAFLHRYYKVTASPRQVPSTGHNVYAISKPKLKTVLPYVYLKKKIALGLKSISRFP